MAAFQNRFSFAVLIALLLSSTPQTSLADQSYVPSGQCDGRPKLLLTTPSGTCIGLIARNLGFPRSVVALSSQTLLVVDMGGWDRRRGRLLQLNLEAGQTPRPVVLLSGLDRPHGLVQSADGKLWLSEATRISEVLLDAPRKSAMANGRVQLRPVLYGAPGTGKHPLIGLAALSEGRLAFSTGSATDACERGWRGKVCAEASGANARASIRVFRPGAQPIEWVNLPPIARGLRNTVAMAEDTVSGSLWGADNGMDLDSATLPPDELNQIEPNSDYGWPHCFGMAQAAPIPRTARRPCTNTARPVRNLPAHSAPLALVLMPSGGLLQRRGLLIAFHGYRATGHKIGFLPLSDTGQIAGRLQDVVAGWDYQRGLKPTGTPSGLAVAPDGSVYIVEDGNGTLLRLSAVSNKPTPLE